MADNYEKVSTDDPSSEREELEQKSTRSEKALTSQEREAVVDKTKLSSLAVYSVVLREGEEELRRPFSSLWWSGVAAGIGISTSVLAEAVIRSGMGSDHAYLTLFESFGYAMGFVLVILCRLQLFTENTITVVLPVLAESTREHLVSAARVWAIVLGANMVGTFFAALLAIFGGVYPEPVVAAVLEISRHVAHIPAHEAFLRGIPAGFLIAAIVWMLPSAKGSELMVILLFTWLIAAGGFTHVVAGSNEMFTLVLSGETSAFSAFSQHILPVLCGNILGGTGLFALLAYGQVYHEM